MVPLHATAAATVEAPLAGLLASWEARPLIVTALVAVMSLYVSGWIHLKRRHTAGATLGALALYLTGLAALALALLSPIEALADRLLTMHMVQHELLTMIAPPLLLLGNPVIVGLWALPSTLRPRIAALLAPGASGRRILGALTFMPVAWLLYALVLWGWHVPAAYEAALESRSSTTSSISRSSVRASSSGGRSSVRRRVSGLTRTASDSSTSWLPSG